MPGRAIFMKTAQENVMHSNIRQMKVYCHNRRITRHGFPTATQFSGMERVTTLPAPMTLFLSHNDYQSSHREEELHRHQSKLHLQS